MTSRTEEDKVTSPPFFDPTIFANSQAANFTSIYRFEFGSPTIIRHPQPTTMTTPFNEVQVRFDGRVPGHAIARFVQPRAVMPAVFPAFLAQRPSRCESPGPRHSCGTAHLLASTMSALWGLTNTGRIPRGGVGVSSHWPPPPSPPFLSSLPFSPPSSLPPLFLQMSPGGKQIGYVDLDLTFDKVCVCGGGGGGEGGRRCAWLAAVSSHSECISPLFPFSQEAAAKADMLKRARLVAREKMIAGEPLLARSSGITDENWAKRLAPPVRAGGAAWRRRALLACCLQMARLVRDGFALPPPH